ncbi:MAG: hypothetical protein KA792_02435 [Bacteroidales bacterium]|nr:hypothetical protein [Bacteroidales bacterium]
MYGQDTIQHKDFNYSTSIGAGIGLDYGGLGIRITTEMNNYLSLFGGLGYNLAGTGVNGGLLFRLFPGYVFRPTISAMYGYNAVFLFEDSNNSKYNRMFFGPSFGFGFELGLFKYRNYLNCSIIVPFRTKEFDEAYNEFKKNSNVRLIKEASPILFSIGIHLFIL